MSADITKRRFTIDEYYQMGAVGILDPNIRTELINGEIIEMSPIGDRHMECVNRAVGLFSSVFVAKKAIVSAQNAVKIDNFSMPQPDLALFRYRADFYKGKHVAEHVLLLIEVSQSTLRYDRNVKLPLYAAAEIPEVWIEDLPDNKLLVFRNPAGKVFTTTLTLGRGDSVTPLALPDLTVSIDELLGL